MTLSDLCTFATDHLRGDHGVGKLLSAKTYKLLHTPELNQYACGWIRTEPGHEIPYTIYWHNGSNTLWYALAAFIPEKNMVVAVTSNDGDFKRAEAAAWEIVKASVKRFNIAADDLRRNRGSNFRPTSNRKYLQYPSMYRSISKRRADAAVSWSGTLFETVDE